MYEQEKELMSTAPDIHEVNYKLNDGLGFTLFVGDATIEIDLIEKIVNIDAQLPAQDLHAHCKRVWIHAELMQHEFPFESMEGGGVAMSPFWRFANFSSRMNVEPRILEFKPIKPEPPMAPETTLTYAPQIFEPGTAIDDIARKVPRGVNYQATRN